jgi:ATP-dependent DNA helicase RecQ
MKTVDIVEYNLHAVFGHSEFRPKQEEIVRGIVRGNDVLAVLPTGAGKSLCFQLPAVVRPGTTIVISPLIALMKDQVDNANKKGVRAVVINSDLSKKESESAYDELQGGGVKLLYIAPERFAVQRFTEMLPRLKIGSIIVDEAHTVDWGYDFRPAYLQVAEHLKSFTGCPRAAFTASATADTQNDIVRRFGLRNPIRVQASFNRPNLTYSVQVKFGDGMVDTLEYIKSNRIAGERGIIYRSTRQKTEDTAELLSRSGIKCLPYHAGLPVAVKRENQAAFTSGAVNWICCTIAFGMGIDIPDIRHVVHADLPKNMEGFYQETGRAGRDGKPSQCVLFYSSEDVRTIKYFIRKSFEENKDFARAERLENQLLKMRQYAELDRCRRKSILAYFGEDLPGDNCGSCDVCLSKFRAGRFEKSFQQKDLFAKV